MENITACLKNFKCRLPSIITFTKIIYISMFYWRHVFVKINCEKKEISITYVEDIVLCESMC